MVTTRKMLVAYDPSHPNKGSAGFLAVVVENARPQLLGIKSGRLSASGLMVYTGRNVSANDVFAKLIESGRKVENVERILGVLESYIRLLQGHRIGDILEIEEDPSEQHGFSLRKTAGGPLRECRK